MVMNNPSHPGRSIRENCLEPLGLNVTEAAKVLGCCPSHPLAGSERPRGHLPRDGHSSREGGLVQCRVLDAPTDQLGSRPSAQATKTGSTSSDTSRSRPPGAPSRRAGRDKAERRGNVELLEKLRTAFASCLASCLTSGEHPMPRQILP